MAPRQPAWNWGVNSLAFDLGARRGGGGGAGMVHAALIGQPLAFNHTGLSKPQKSQDGTAPPALLLRGKRDVA